MPDTELAPPRIARLDRQAPAATRVRTLLVDDSEAVREGLGLLLAAQPYCELVGAVADPAEAVETTRSAHPHVVLQDFSMPGVDPFALTRELSACRPRPAVLVLSAIADAHAAREATRAGAIGWVLKDAEPEQLFAALLGAAGFGDGHRPLRVAESQRVRLLPPEPEPDGAAMRDARTVWAVLRALQGEPFGLTAEGLANRAVLPVASAVRHVQRLAARRFVDATDAAPTDRTYRLTGAGERELARLEARIPLPVAAR